VAHDLKFTKNILSDQVCDFPSENKRPYFENKVWHWFSINKTSRIWILELGLKWV